MLDTHEECLGELQRCCDEQDFVGLGVVMDRLSQCIEEHYVRFMNRQEICLNQIKVCEGTDPELYKEMAALVAHPVLKGLSLGSLLIKPMQRTIAYMLTFDRACKHTVDVDKKTQLQQIATRVKSAITTMDSATRAQYKMRTLVTSTKGLEALWDELVVEGMNIVDEVEMDTSDKHPVDEVHLYLLNDRCIVCDKEGAAKTVRHIFDANEDIYSYEVEPLQWEESLDALPVMVGFSIRQTRQEESGTRPTAAVTIEESFYHADKKVNETWCWHLEELFSGRLSASNADEPTLRVSSLSSGLNDNATTEWNPNMQ